MPDRKRSPDPTRKSRRFGTDGRSNEGPNFVDENGKDYYWVVKEEGSAEGQRLPTGVNIFCNMRSNQKTKKIDRAENILESQRKE